VKPQQIKPVFRERVWGRTDLSPFFPEPEEPVGEVWFSPSYEEKLLIKLIFTSANLSVQVHPNDEYAKEHENSCGKSEMWHILAAEPDAKLAIGFAEDVDRDTVERALREGTVESLLNWMPANAGDTFMIPAGTIHALGAGITLCEIQQNSDVTYRLFDYGRPRKLHIDKGLAVLNFSKGAGLTELPVDCDYFHTEVYWMTEGAHVWKTDKPECLIILDGEGNINGNPFKAGQVWESPGQSMAQFFCNQDLRVLATSAG
jgi:mannose-6-phosphate isomerase